MAEPGVTTSETRHERRARKRHRCAGCPEPIEVGTLYTDIEVSAFGDLVGPGHQRRRFHLHCTPPTH